MNNNLYKIEQSLRSIAKKYKTVKYSIALAILFLMLGINAFSEEINGAEFVEQSKSIRSGMKNSIEDMRSKIENVRAENNKGMGDLKLELIQLMEQGDQVVKSPWNSWQFGANYFYNNWRGTYQGKGDKKEKYPFEGVFTRSDDLFLRYIHPDSKHYEKYTSSLSTISHSLSTFSAGSSTPQKTFAETPKSVGKNRTLATTSSRGGDEDSYGLANSRIRQEDISKIELGVTIRPRQVNKDLITIQAPDKPVVNRPVVTLPESPSTPEAPTPPTLSLTPFEPVVPKSPEASLGEAPIFNIKLGSFRNHMTQSNNALDGDEDGGGLKGDKANAKSYEHNGNKEIGNNDLGTYATRYAWGSPSAALKIDDGFDSALLKVYFDYGKANGNATGGGTLTIKEEVNKTIDSINNLSDSQKAYEASKGREWNTGRFLTGGSRFASMDNAVNAKIVNKGTINLAGPLVVGFEIQSDTIGSGGRTVENDGTITDKIEEGYRGNEGLGGLKVGKVDEDGNVIESANDSTELTLPPFARESPTDTKLKIKRTPDVVKKNNPNEIVTKGGYTGYKVGMILTYENNDARDNSLYSLINNGKILFKGDKSIGIQIFAPRSYNTRVDIKNRGEISIGGIESYGMKISSRIKRKDKNAPAGTFIGNDEKGIINVSGGNGRKNSLSSGIAVIEDQKLRLDTEKLHEYKGYLRAYNDYVKNKGTINVSGGIGNTGMFLKLEANDDITNEGKINVSGIKNIGMRVTSGDLPTFQQEEEGGGQDRAASLVSFIEDVEGNIFLPYFVNTTPIAYNKKDIKLFSGEENIGMVSEGKSIADNSKDGKITIAGGNKNIGMLSERREKPEQPASADDATGFIVNRGIIETGDNSTAKNTIGMAMKNGTTGLNIGKGKIDLKGEGAIGVYNDNSNFEMRNNSKGESPDDTPNDVTPEIKVSGKNSVAVYAKGNNSKTRIKNGTISAEQGITLYADNSIIELGRKKSSGVNSLNSPKLIAKNGALMFYNYSLNGNTQKANGAFRLNNSANGTVEKGGTAFYLRNVVDSDKGAFLNKMFKDTSENSEEASESGKKLYLTMKEGSTLFVTQNDNIDNVTSPQSLSTLSVHGLNRYGNRVEITNDSSPYYKIESALRNKLLVDRDVNLDDKAEAYNRLEYLSSWVTVKSGINMKSGTDKRIAIFQANMKRESGSTLPAPKAEDIQVSNKGNITLTGKKSIGLATSFGLVTNEGNVSVTGEESVGMYAADSSVAKNTGTIEVGTKSTGIYAENDLKDKGNSTAISENKNINITNTGTIKGKAGSTGVYGIYAKNDKANYSKATSTITHSGNIDLSNSTSSVGIYTENGKLTSSGSISVGKNSIGINATNSEVELSQTGSVNATSAIGVLTRNGNLKSRANLTVKNGIGVDVDKSKVDIEGGTYNLDKSVAFRIGDLTGGYFKGNGGNINITGKNSVAYYLKNANLTSNSNFIDNLTVTSNNNSYTYLYAEDSTLNYENQKTINSDGSTFIYAKNSDITLKENTDISSSKTNVTAIYSEGTGTKNIINKGKIKLLGAKSLGIYSKGDKKVENFGNIEVGEKSTAIYAENISDIVRNTANIKLGTNSTGISVRNAKLNNTGNIESRGVNSIKNIGIYSSGNKGLTNSGNITLLGNQSTGIYSEGSNIINTGKISVGNSADAKNPSIGIYSKNGKIENSGEISTGNKSVGLYGTDVDLKANTKVTSGDEGTGIYSTGGTVNLENNSQITVGNNGATAVYYAGKNGNVVSNTDKLNVGNNSSVFTIRGQNNKVESNSTGTVNLRNNSMYMYSTDSSGRITNRTNIASSGDNNYGIYSAGKVDNHANIDFSSGIGSIGMYAYYPKNDSYSLSTLGTTPPIPTVTNHSGSRINVAKSDLSDSKNERYGIGMAAGYTLTNGNRVTQKAIGHIVNYGTISVTHANSIGMYATGRGSIAENRGRIELSGNKRNIGMYLENGAEGYNYGTITTVGSNNNGQIGVAVTTGATIHNYGTININAENGIGIYNFGGGIVRNYGRFVINAPTQIKTLDQADTSKGLGGVDIRVRKDDKSIADIFVNGKKVNPTLVHRLPNNAPSRIPTSSIGIYMSSSGINPTRPIENLGALARSGIKSADLIIGVEASKYTNSKYIQLGQDIIEPYNKMIKEAMRKGISKWEIYSGSLTWQATVTQNKADQTIQNAYMTKIPYTVYASDKNTTRDTYNFTDGLEQRYGVEAIGSREKELFNKLNSIGNNEGILLKQAFDEMMGHQYANLHQRVQSTGDILDKEFTHLREDWATASKKSHKVKTFGARGEYKTNTAGVINTTNDAYGVAYVYENEDIKLGKGYGYYTGLVYNTYKFKDIGRSKEEMLQVKVGAFKSIPFDDNNSLNWTVSGDISYGYNKMHRKFLVVNEIFNARGRYNTYGVAMKNELGKEFRLTETISLRPYGAINLEYMKVGKVKEKSGEIKLDVKGSHYTSIKPELGIEANYKYTMLSGKIITARLGTAFEDELGKVAKANNKAKVADTSADWFNLPKEKEDRKGNIKTDFSIGVEGEMLGGTANIGYDTKGNNIRGGIGVRIIF